MTETVKKATVRNAAFWVCLCLSIGLIVGGFLVPPTGKIDGSVLTGVGELFAFATLEVVAAAIHNGTDAKIKHNNTEVTIGDLNGKEADNVQVAEGEQ